MKIDWSTITREHVLTAISLFLSEEINYPEAKSTFLMFDGKKLPAKHIRGMAYKVAYGKEVSKQDYSGGMETVRFFRNLGFDMHYAGEIISENTTETIYTEPVHKKTSPEKQNKAEISIPTKGVIEQKNALQLILNKMFDGDIVCEKSFPWLITPATYSGHYEKIYNALHAYRGDDNFANKNVRLRCDFVCESQKLIIEYDERQHFTKARQIALACYDDMPLCYDAKLWEAACNTINAKDNVPINRDETRAYYDSVRDIEAARNGYRLIRIMHGQIDFTQENAKELLSEILNVTPSENNGLKIGLYLQTNNAHSIGEFQKAISEVKKADLDLLVFPEISYTPFCKLLYNSDITDENDFNKILKECMHLSKEAACAVIVGYEDCDGLIYSLYANAACKDDETEYCVYYKHTATSFSCFDLPSFREYSNQNFTPITLKGHKIGMTICYDCNHALFSRMYGVQNIDVIVNLTGGNVVYDKWHKYTKARAIENNCFTFTTMGGDTEGNSYVYGFSPSGKELKPEIIYGKGNKLNIPGAVYMYTTDSNDSVGQADRRLYQNHSKNKFIDFTLNSAELTALLKSSTEIESNLYTCRYAGTDLIFILVKNEDIFHAEKFLPLMYSEKLNKYKNKRYILVNEFDHLTKEFYENKLSVVLKVRAMENYCAVLLKSDLLTMCYQTSQNKTAQVLKSENGCFGLDLARMKGPETIWKNSAIWRDGYAWLIQQCTRFSETGCW